MSIFKRIFLVTILIINISSSFCFAIDENQFSPNGENTTTVTETEFDNTSSGDDSVPTSIITTDDDQESTIVSSVSSASNKSTITNILNIALIVVGVLLIFLAIAILIRLK